MVVTHTLHVGDPVELTAAIEPAPAGARGGVLARIPASPSQRDDSAVKPSGCQST
jgi:hypothetical protein